jgi:purine nucleoside phosphorylase
MDYNRSKESADYINQRTSIRPQLGIICGSGWGKTFGSKISTEVHIVNMT